MATPEKKYSRREALGLGLFLGSVVSFGFALYDYQEWSQKKRKASDLRTIESPKEAAPTPLKTAETPIYLSDQGLRESKPTTAEANQGFRDLVGKDIVLYLSLNSWRTGQPERIEVAEKVYYLIPIASRVKGNVTLPNILLDKDQYNDYTTYYWGFPRRMEYGSLFVEIPFGTTFKFKVIEVPVKGKREIVLSLKSPTQK